MTIPSAAFIFGYSSFTQSSIAQRPGCSAHVPQAAQPRTGLPPAWYSSVENPASAHTPRTVRSIWAVLPSGFGLPLIASMFIFNQTFRFDDIKNGTVTNYTIPF
jgi:hypothetical protein